MRRILVQLHGNHPFKPFAPRDRERGEMPKIAVKSTAALTSKRENARAGDSRY